jgi:hypothetical protein
MQKRVRDWYFQKLITALRKSDIRYESAPRVRTPGNKAKRPPLCDGYCQWIEQENRYRIVIRYRPSYVNELYVIIHEGLHAAFPEVPERESNGEFIDLQSRILMYVFSTRQLKEIESYLPRR